MSFRSENIPLFVQHKTNRINVGIVEGVTVEGGVVRGRIRFGSSDEARQYERDVAGGIIENVSIGYEISEQRQEQQPDGSILHVVTKFKIGELSLVGLPADPLAQIHRERNMFTEPKKDTVESELENYSLQNVLIALNDRNARVDIGREREISDELTRAAGLASTNGIMIPDEIMMPRGRTATPEQYAAAVMNPAALVGTDYRPDMFTEYLRFNSAFLNKGLTTLSGLVGNVSFSKDDGVIAAGWFNADGTGSIDKTDSSFSTVTMSPKFAGAIAEFSMAAMYQSSPDIQQYLRNELMRAYNEVIDTAIAYGSGTGNEPKGIAKMTGINTKAPAKDGAPTLAELRDIEKTLRKAKASNLTFVSDINIDDHLAYELAHPTTNNGATLGETWRIKGEGNGLIKDNEMFVFDPKNIILGRWGGIILDTDQGGTRFDNGLTGVRVVGAVDIATRHASHFTYVRKEPA
ncbi:TPA: phage major capsid protein [Vibrio parahaemolyticus]|nr:phage major capsid protein [Vibrio parahaemolyticus]HCE2322286.1 phage major capsid protein [Vibrio parahaemolyticus]HCE2338225.1 phage major capsid protein [Vibrio parahaemolyticus]HCE2353956.1 phage major capsid protein [Vibrio parahaemolyticus]HCE2359068.1 phage major capsid protein [Vibrio parahaemolyticus]